MEKTSVTLQDIREAAERIRPFIRRTPLLREATLDNLLGCQVYLKPEMLQITGAFKLRGALSKILTLTPEERVRGIITSSSGNHAQACAYAGQLLGIKVTVIVPDDTPHLKVSNARRMGANVILWERTYAERWKKVQQEVEEHGYSIVHAFEDYTVMAGQGTIALEIMEDLPDVETVLVPIGGGGLISGISTAIKESNPKIRVVGVQAANSDGFRASREAGQRIRIQSKPTIADGITCSMPTERPFQVVERYVDEIVSVEENDIREAVRQIAREAKLIAEPTSSVVVGALLAHKITVRPDEKVALVLTSGNWDIENIGKIFKDEPVPGVL